ncbi:hypothetical protein [Anaerotignum sp. MB30-C6]|uniref:hypothetical protein n=1 Tax=Anaerotignum sp. MB30-C6 TaxID=3070814 RepID=UPI0027DE87A9|nr:hypothetical protein [Anaerotignum sp. MB30-C6]WMI80940.1 hypothetical protein RBQ60_14135 [Anaerotignum sp. MB30-C6]
MDSLVPENDLQELWEQSGRVKALIAYTSLRKYATAEEIKAILSGEIEESEEGDTHEE